MLILVEKKQKGSLNLLQSLGLLKYREIKAVLSFIADSTIPLSYNEKVGLIKKLYKISYNIDCPHTNEEILSFIKTVLLIPKETKGCIIEAGCYKGGSTSKFSIAAKLVDRELIVFDSFQGIPEHNESHGYNIYGKPVTFSEGEYCGTIEEVKLNIKKYGFLDVCTFVEGWFQDTLFHFKKPVVAAYIDVDLADSVKQCIKFIFPLLVEGESLFCHDGHLPLVIAALNDDSFWMNEVGFRKPCIEGLWQNKLIRIIKSNR